MAGGAIKTEEEALAMEEGLQSLEAEENERGIQRKQSKALRLRQKGSIYKKLAKTLLGEFKETQLGALEIAKNTAKHLSSAVVIERLEEVRHAGGRPQTYDSSWMPQKAFEILSDASIVAPKAYVAACLGVDVKTLYRWADDTTKPEFCQAIAWGVAVQEAQLATMMRGGFKYSNNLFAILKNLHDWKDRTEETQVKIDVAGIVRAVESGAPRVDWDREQVIDAEIVDAKASAEADTRALSVLPSEQATEASA
jgi:hypothetical protein